MIPLSDYKKIKNRICATTNCNNPVISRIIFSLGFSAGFCTQCSDRLVTEGLGIREQKNDAIDVIEHSTSLAFHTSNSEVSKVDV